MAKGIPLRKRIFIGCEGASEKSYVRWLQAIADARGKHLFLDSHDAGGGDPLAIVEASISKLRQQEKLRGKYSSKAVILDTDKIGLEPARDQQMVNIAAKSGLFIIKQEEIHEAIILRHFPNCANLKPPKAATEPRLKKEWPDYQKPADAMAYGAKLDFAAFSRMLGVEADFNSFFNKLIV